MTERVVSTDEWDILKFEEELSNFFEDLMYDRGGSPLLGRIYTLCLLKGPDVPLLQKDLSRKFNVNPSTISRNLKELEKLRLVTRRRAPGAREWSYYLEETSFINLFLNTIKDHKLVLREKRRELQRIKLYWDHNLSSKSKNTEKGKKVLQVLDVLVAWIFRVETELGLFIQQLRSQFATIEKEIVQFGQA